MLPGPDHGVVVLMMKGIFVHGMPLALHSRAEEEKKGLLAAPETVDEDSPTALEELEAGSKSKHCHTRLRAVAIVDSAVGCTAGEAEEYLGEKSKYGSRRWQGSSASNSLCGCPAY